MRESNQFESKFLAGPTPPLFMTDQVGNGKVLSRHLAPIVRPHA